ncbi:MAG TPA: APC family permease [Virgibacillus sp.]|nr:APC family permease [Virgibacillus sp.]HLR69780.1 APC family permease [Virgibacillus sp.]
MNERTKLKKSLQAKWIWAIALGAAIGWGAFVQPFHWMETAGPIGVILGFTIGALLMTLIAFSYGFLIQKYPVSGGEFAYAFISLGRNHAFISGWFLTLGYICIVALNASALSLMFKYVFPRLIEHTHLYTIAGWDVYATEVFISTIGLLIFGYLNIKGTSLSGKTQYLFAILMILSVISLTLLVGIQPSSSLTNIQPFFPENKSAIVAIISIVAIAPWAYVGFDIVPQTAEEFNFPAKKAFGLIVFAIFFAALIYSLMIISSGMVQPWQNTIDENHLWGTGYVIDSLLGPIGVAILVVALSMGIFTGLNGFILATSRLLFAMARARFIPKQFGELHPTYKTPYKSIVFIVIIAAIAPWLGREALVWIVDMSSIGVSIAYLYTCITAYKLFSWKYAKNNSSIVAPSKKLIALIGIVASVIFILLLLLPFSPAFLGKESLTALIIWILLGIGFYILKYKQLKNLSDKELTYLILGSRSKN